ncbi:2-polyprenyl-6-methoxyphenol hydroxylase-like FAD-dependent oxidoreductase [Crossiella equi]|uniref:2-polyprenyl-6-methoxyphenol hydroxylase-like FAD-dependent oxidoreductase n=1 Tax=Crossiella equi TaxID=130796 RepID=A0ABS5AS13_9PSEU|nr:FAD-dependent oxidoreductase [Crossiella equi]MBP2479211.1 2-polyprenyl-6-methoxyphenol hydroxylase-like FAD-dependent oxidoreductase [Crossiella equi]
MEATRRGHPWGHAVVIGAGIAGLVTARVLADHFGRVTVLEQDLVDGETEYRSGVPQARHPHALLARGGQILDELFPGLSTELTEAGAPIGDYGQVMRMRLPTGWAPRGPLGITMQTFTRVRLEGAIRRRVLVRPEITLVGGFRAAGLVFDSTAQRVTGVRGRQRAEDRSERDLVIDDADLVVDASGRTTKLPDWLAGAGYGEPEVRTVDGKLSYASRLFHAPENFTRDWTSTAQLVLAPGRRGGGVVAVEEGRWLITMIGAGGETPPNDEEGFLAYARSLDNPHIAECITEGKPAGPLYRAVNLTNRWTRYHRMKRWPDRLVAIGDTVCTFNPMYGQGMTVSAMQADALRVMLADRARGGGLDGFARRFQRRTAKVIQLPWLIATQADRGWTEGKPGLFDKAASGYLGAVMNAMPEEIDLYRRFYQVAQLVKGPAVLVSPKVLARVARGRRSA